MKIINYNKINHDIYTFDESAMVLCALPSSANESIPGVRRHATITGWNTAGLWNNNIDGSGVPDWSGLSARSRGSNLYGVPRQNLIPPLVAEFNGVPGSNNPEFSKITNWNNGIPVYIIISKKHFIACAHFIGLSNFNPMSFDILDKDGVMHSITGEFVSHYQDNNLYRITSITGGSLPPATEINPTHKIKIYQILNLSSYTSFLEGLRIWYQVNNGMFVTTTLLNGIITFSNAAQGQPSAPSPESGLPIIYALQQVWVGDSGTPMLATYNGETYFIGMANGGAADYSKPGVLSWLRSNVLPDNITITLFDPVPNPTFSCNTNTGDCISDPNGTWVNKSDCDAACNIIVPTRVDCINGQCTETNPNGVYATIQECQSSLTCTPPPRNDVLIYLDTIPNPTQEWIAKFKALGVKFQGLIFQNEGNDFENFLPGTTTLGNNSMINPINSAEIISRLNADMNNPGGKPLLIQDPSFYDAIGLNFNELDRAIDLVLGDSTTQTEVIDLLIDMKSAWSSGPLANKEWCFGLDLNSFLVSSQMGLYGFCKEGNPFTQFPSNCIPPQSTFGEGAATAESGYTRAQPLFWELSDARINEILDFIINRDTSMGLASDIILTYCFPMYSESNFSTNGSSVPLANIWTDTVAPEDMKSFHWGSKLTRRFTNILNSTDSGNRKALAQISATGWYLNNISKNSMLQIANEVIANDIGIFLWTAFGGDQSRMTYSYNRSGFLYDACRPDIGLNRDASGQLTAYGQTQVTYRKMFARAFYGATPGNENISDDFWKSDERYAELTERATQWLYDLCLDIRQINVAPVQQNSESLTYDVWAAAFSGSQWITTNHPWMTGDYRFHSVVPMAQMESVTNNGRRTAPTTPSAFAYTQLKDRLNTIPKGRRVVLNWFNMNDVSPFEKKENDYYKNTLDGFFYKGATFLSIWQDTNSRDAGQELTRIFGLLDSDQIDLDYIFDDHEAEAGLYGMQGQNAYPPRDSSGNPVSIYGDTGTLPDARVFGAIISDPRFTTEENRFSGRSFSEDFLDFYKQLSKQPNSTLTTQQILQPWLQVNTAAEFHTPSDSPAINPITSRPYSDERNFMIPAWQGSYYLHLKYGYWARTQNTYILDFPRYADVIISNYESCPISIEEAEYTRDSNNVRTFIPPLSNTTIASGGHAMFGINLNLIYAYWTDPLVNPNTAYNGNSGYVRNPQTDIDRYNWAYYLINPSTIPATVDFKKYAETISIPDFASKRAHKQLINDVKFMRHILRSSPLWWQQNVPNISYPRIHYYDSPNHNDWHELVYHVILHGLLYIMYFSESYDPSNVKLLHDALVEWKRISINSGVEPCSRVDGNVSSNATPVDRVLLHDAVENILISGGRSLKSGKYIWRLTAPPSMRVGNFIYFRRLPSETDHTLPETIVVDCSVKINGRGAWIVRDVQGMPKYESYIPTTPPPRYSCNASTTNCDPDVNGSWDDKEACEIFCSNITPINRVDCINDVCTETNPDGRYVNVEECLSGSVCSPVVPPTTTYDCINTQCVAITRGLPGPFISINACRQNCFDTIPSSWDCVNNTCIEFIDDPFHQYSTLEICSQNCSVIPPTVTFDCIGGKCKPVFGDPAGTYTDLLSCTLACRVREINTWECIDSLCQEITGPSGSYTTEEQCLGSDCGSEVPVTTYNCVSGVCVAIDGPDGTYRTQSDCINRGCGIIIPPTPPNITNKILENPQFIDLSKSIPTTPLSGYPYNSR